MTLTCVESHFYFKRKVLSTLVPGSKPLDKDDSSEDPDSDSEDDRQDYLVDEFECLKNITAVEEVQVYYRDDGRVSLKVPIAIYSRPLCLREAHLTSARST